jgi:hypothetical protein
MAKKKKFKKALKALGAGLAIAGIGKALANRKRNQANVELDLPMAEPMYEASEGAIIPAPRVYEDDIMRGGSGVKYGRKIPGMIVEGDRYSMLDSMGFKKGGRVGCGKAKRGYGKAMRKK